MKINYSAITHNKLGKKFTRRVIREEVTEEDLQEMIENKLSKENEDFHSLSMFQIENIEL